MVLLAAGGTAAAIKLTQKDAHRIEEHTGLPPEQLEDQDLEQAMQELNIQPQQVSPQEQAALTQQNITAPSQELYDQVQPSASVEPSEAKLPDYIAELEHLDELRQKGIVTDAEFEAKKKQMLGL